MSTPPIGQPQPMLAAQMLARLRTVGVLVGAVTLTNTSGSLIPYGAACTIEDVLGVPAPALADSDNEVTAYARCICVQAGGIADGASGLFAFASCIVTGLTGGAVGAEAFVGNVAGEITNTPPATGYIRRVGYWLDATRLVWAPDLFPPALVES